MIDRAKGIGASEVAALVGLSPWTTPVEVWLDKVGLGRPRDETPQMTTGRDLELAVLKLGAAQLSRRIVHNARTFTHRGWPDVPLFATPDGFGPGRDTLAEVKVVSHHLSDWSDGPPPYVVAQCQAQMAVYAKATAVDVIALVGGAIRTYVVERDRATILDIEVLVGRWWRDYVVAEVAPPAQSADDEWALLRARIVPDHQERLATTDEQVVANDLVGLLAERARIDALVDEGRRALATASGGHDIAGVGWSGRWQSRSSVDWKAVRKIVGIPDDVVEAYTRTTPLFIVRRSGGDRIVEEGVFV
jgi:putative phage-type endonuclease